MPSSRLEDKSRFRYDVDGNIPLRCGVTSAFVTSHRHRLKLPDDAVNHHHHTRDTRIDFYLRPAKILPDCADRRKSMT